jgi:hypothetical protein
MNQSRGFSREAIKFTTDIVGQYGHEKTVIDKKEAAW